MPTFPAVDCAVRGVEISHADSRSPHPRVSRREVGKAAMNLRTPRRLGVAMKRICVANRPASAFRAQLSQSWDWRLRIWAGQRQRRHLQGEGSVQQALDRACELFGK